MALVTFGLFSMTFRSSQPASAIRPAPHFAISQFVLRLLTTLTVALSLSFAPLIYSQDAADRADTNVQAHATDGAKLESETIAPKAPAIPEGPYKVRIETTKGSIFIELFPNEAPLSVGNFLQLVDSEFFNGTVFHRVIANFMIQAGGYDAKLTYKTPPRTVANESVNGLKNLRGTLAMARREHPDSADSQFFINMRDNPHLDPVGDRAGYSVFGKVIAGMETAERIELVDTGIQAGQAAVPEEPIEIISVTRLP